MGSRAKRVFAGSFRSCLMTFDASGASVEALTMSAAVQALWKSSIETAAAQMHEAAMRISTGV